MNGAKGSKRLRLRQDGKGLRAREVSGLRSRWTTLRLCASCIARASASTSLAASRASSGLPSSLSARLPSRCPASRGNMHR